MSPTIFDTDVLDWISFPQFLILICVAHQWEDYFLDNALGTRQYWWHFVNR